MLGDLAGTLLKRELREIRRRATGLELILAAVLMLVVALGFLSLALFLWLSTLMQPWQAALVSAAVPAVSSLVLWLAGRLVMRPRRRQAEDLGPELGPALGRSLLGGGRGRRPKAEVYVGLLVAGAIAGWVLGRPDKD